MRYLCASILSICIAVPTTVFADDANKSDFTFTAYIDGSYNYLVNDNKFVSGTFDRVFDIEGNGFTLQQASFTLAKKPTCGLGFLFNPILGRDANEIAAYGVNPYHGSQTVGFDPTQLYGSYTRGALTVIAGRFVTLAGAEVIDPTQDTNFSRSLLFGFAIPFTNMGVRATYTVSDKFSFIFGVNNGWDNIRDTSRAKTEEIGITYNPNSTFSLAMSGYSGGQRATDRTHTGPQSRRNLIDIVATYNMTDCLSFIGNYDYGMQPKATRADGRVGRADWQGVAGYVNYKLNDKWQTSLRGEIFNDPNGYRTGVDQDIKEMTVTVAYSPLKSLVLRGETRHDYSNNHAFYTKHEKGSSKNQQSYALEGIYKFGY